MGRRGPTTRYPVRVEAKMSEAMAGQVDFIARLRGEDRADTIRYLVGVGIHHEHTERIGNGSLES